MSGLHLEHYAWIQLPMKKKPSCCQDSPGMVNMADGKSQSSGTKRDTEIWLRLAGYQALQRPSFHFILSNDDDRPLAESHRFSLRYCGEMIQVLIKECLASSVSSKGKSRIWTFYSHISNTGMIGMTVYILWRNHCCTVTNNNNLRMSLAVQGRVHLQPDAHWEPEAGRS